ncbi:hypothetical protein PC119_g8013 [Phytophthora cactorum]|uniref:AAA+ ATPase domain-containing protein n=2 Tax=Phytophthora cactorum TaxID=29920 RepID=A0A8T1CPP1_9STRA|nr:hypothetical protein PC114_g4816 [Phytophthora cactorum]KAG2928838.1 hypothetical protein PC115_g7108 [Phytophthora cactorum]KAG2941574.1 hypothetical protein PC117_g10175 [Phytophthora cactorum]KAG3025928.1 hypothetical protein PC119_g8013 [Phytophthora cactorum]KAG3199372.1 hypothetical protein PC128_g5308 [Phytophthora cactorum]
MSLLGSIITDTADTLTGTSPTTPTPTTRTPTPTTRIPTPTTRTPTPTTRTPTPATPAPVATTATPMETTATPTTISSASTTSTSTPSEAQLTPAPASSSSSSGVPETSAPASATANANASTTVIINVNSHSDDSDASSGLATVESSDEGISTGVVIGIVAGAVVFVLLIAGFAFWLYRRRKHKMTPRSPSFDASYAIAPVTLPAAEPIILESYTPSRAIAVHDLNNFDRTLYLDSTGNLDSTLRLDSSAASIPSTNKTIKTGSTLWEDEAILAARIPMEKLIRKELVNEGGHGAVYHGLYRGECVAIKVLLPDKPRSMATPAAPSNAVPPPAPANAYAAAASDPSLPKIYPKPVTILVIGMAGSGKTTLMQRLAAYGVDSGLRNYIINLDPAVRKTGYTANVDIRDTVDYKQVMSEYGLGPNGAIMTSLNLFATRFDQVIDLLGKRSGDLDYAIVDTPGQIEAFTWSASGQIITESLASTFPSVIVILYKLKLPFVVVFNKIDVMRHDFATEWMTDFEAFQTALDEVQDDSYMGSLSRSLSLVLEEFYNNLTSVGVSAATGEGMPEFFAAIDEAAKQYENEYLPDLLERIKQQQKKKQEQEEATLSNVMQDMEISAHRDEDVPAGDAPMPNVAGERTDL